MAKRRSQTSHDFPMLKILATQTQSPPTEASNADGVG